MRAGVADLDRFQARKPVPFVPSPMDVVERMLEIAGVEEGEKVYDLGCGDGRVLFTAASKYRAYGVGYEIRDGLVRYVRNRVHGLGLDNYITVFRKDLAKADLTGANVVTLYLTTPMLRTVSNKLYNALQSGARVVSHDYPIPGLEPTEIHRWRGRRIYLYTKARRL
jgi:cyclopropane fatty-acyl-phospholipid synthase-like methyltransferase